LNGIMNIGIIGLGYWGPNIVRNALAVDSIDRVVACDIDEAQLAKIKAKHPEAEISNSVDGLLADDSIDGVVVVLPVDLHYPIAMKAIAAGKHVVLEKPFTSTVAQGEEILEAADKKGVITMVDHTFLYTGAVRQIKTLVNNGTLGDIYFYDSARTNLGLFQRDCNVIWDLAPHDFSIMNHVIGKRPVSVQAMGGDHAGRGFVDVAYVHVDFGDNTIAHFHVSWLSPIKERQTVIGGDKKMVVWDDNNATERVKIYDKGFSMTAEAGKHPSFQYRNGEYEVAPVEQTEALALMLEEFASAVKEKRQPLTSGRDGVEVVRILEACEQSLAKGGAAVKL
jgi:predicted dehydrogenase